MKKKTFVDIILTSKLGSESPFERKMVKLIALFWEEFSVLFLLMSEQYRKYSVFLAAIFIIILLCLEKKYRNYCFALSFSLYSTTSCIFIYREKKAPIRTCTGFHYWQQQNCFKTAATSVLYSKPRTPSSLAFDKSDKITLGVLRPPFRLAEKQSTKVNTPLACGLFLLYLACCLIARLYADNSKLSYTTTLS